MSAPGDNSRRVVVVVGVLSVAAIWLLAVVVFSKGGPGAVTAFGLLVMFAMMLMFLSWEARDGRQMDQERIVRNRKRRAWRQRRKQGKRSPKDE